MKSLAEKLTAAAVAAVFALQAWTLKEVVSLKVQVARLETRLDASHISAAPPGTSHLAAQP